MSTTLHSFYGAEVNISTKFFPPHLGQKIEVQEDGSSKSIMSGPEYELVLVMSKRLNFTARMLLRDSWLEVSVMNDT